MLSLLVLAILAAGVGAEPGEAEDMASGYSVEEVERNLLGFRDDGASHRPRDVPLEPGAGWFSFQFREAGSTAHTAFVFDLASPHILKLTDYFCSGDSFTLYDHGKPVATSPPVPFDHCATNTTSPDWAFAHAGQFSSATVQLDAGWHRIQLRTDVAHYGGGSAALRIDPIYLQCQAAKSADNHRLRVLQTPVRHGQAAEACRAIGLRWATVEHIPAAADVAFQCVGAFQRLWIKGYGEEGEKSALDLGRLGAACMVLKTAVAAPGGSVGLEANCQAALPVLCEEEQAE